MFLNIFFFSKDSAKNWPKVKKGDRKRTKIDTKTGITQVLIELQQKFFQQHWAKTWSKTVNFEYVPFLLKHKTLKDCSSTVFVL